MRNFKFLILFFIFMTFILASLVADNQKSLADLYKTGEIRLIPEIVLDEKSMPEGVFFETPFYIPSDPEGNIYVFDYKANNIKKFDATGKFIKVIGREGQGPGEFSGPYSGTFAKDRLIVWDMGNRRLCSLTPDGEFIKAARISFDSGSPRNIRSLPHGDILIEKEIMSYIEIDKPQECVIELISPDLEHKKTIYSHEIWRRRTITTPKRTNIPQPYTFLVYWDVIADGKIVIGFSEKYEIEIHDCDKGKILSFSHSFEPVKVTEEDKKSYFAGLSYSVDGVQQKVPDYIVDNTKFPKFKPAFRSIIADSEGNILVFPHRIKREENFRYFDAFDSQGNFIANVRVVGDVSFPTISGVGFTGKYIWTPRSGEDELARIIKYRITD